LVVRLVFTKSSIVVTLMMTHDDESSHRSSPCRQESSHRSSPCRQESSSGRHRVVTSRHNASPWSSSVVTLVVTGLHQKKATTYFYFLHNHLDHGTLFFVGGRGKLPLSQTTIALLHRNETNHSLMQPSPLRPMLSKYELQINHQPSTILSIENDRPLTDNNTNTDKRRRMRALVSLLAVASAESFTNTALCHSSSIDTTSSASSRSLPQRRQFIIFPLVNSQ
jgi:hypothetical protein